MTQVEIAKHLDLSERKLREFLKKSGIDHKKTELEDIRRSYIRRLREVASGRLGEGGIADAKKRLIEVQIEKEEIRVKTLKFDLNVKKNRIKRENIQLEIEDKGNQLKILGFSLDDLLEEIEENKKYEKEQSERLDVLYEIFEVLNDCVKAEEEKGNIKEIDGYPYYEATWMNKPK